MQSGVQNGHAARTHDASARGAPVIRSPSVSTMMPSTGADMMRQSIHQRFETEVVESMLEALGGVLVALGVSDAPNDLSVRAAEKVIELVTAGERDPERLKAGTLRAFWN